MLQIVQTRILSVVSMYYLAFLSISMAMLGMTAGALLVYFKLDKITSCEHRRISVADIDPVRAHHFRSLLLQLASPLPLVGLATLAVMWLKMLFLLAAPFAVGGIIVSLALTRSPFPVGITYGVDLLGAAFGCLAVLLLLNWVDAPSAILVVAAIAAFAGLCPLVARPGGEAGRSVSELAGPASRPALVGLVLLGVAGANASTRYGLQPIATKFGKINVGVNYDFERWNSFSRILADKNLKARTLPFGELPLPCPSRCRLSNVGSTSTGLPDR